MKVLISGATGFIGVNVLQELESAGYEISILVRDTTDTSKISKKIKKYNFNHDLPSLIEYMESEKFDGVIHLASLFLASHKSEDVESLVTSNVVFSTLLLEAAVRAKIPWFINTGTFWQHYKNKRYSPVNLYAATKEAFEIIAKYYLETTTINFVTIQLSDTFGTLDTRPKIFNLLSKISKSGETLEMSPGEQLLDITHVKNIVDAYRQLSQLLAKDTKRKLKGKVFALSSRKVISLKKFVSIFEKVSGTKLNITWGGRPYRQREVMVPWNKGIKVPGWKPKITLEEGIRLTLKEEPQSKNKES